MAVRIYSDRVDFEPAQREEWMDRKACVDADDLEIFFPGRNQAAKEAEAKSFCNVCEVQRECLVFALIAEKDSYMRHGIFGGKTATERRTLWLALHPEEEQDEEVDSDDSDSDSELEAAIAC
jgi:hypothetical protein